MQINDAALDLIKSHEGLRLQAYKDPVGVWTIGYGTTSRAGIGVTVSPGMEITQGQAEDYLRRALELFGNKIKPGFTRQPTPNQYGAMLSLAYNIGPGAFLKSTCLKRFNAGDIEGAAEALQWFNKAGGRVLRGLVRRRLEEAELFLSETTSQAPMPRPDNLRTTPVESTTVLAGAGQAMAGVSAAAGAVATLEGPAQLVAIAMGGIVVLFALWIIRERLRKWTEGDR